VTRSQANLMLSGASVGLLIAVLNARGQPLSRVLAEGAGGGLAGAALFPAIVYASSRRRRASYQDNLMRKALVETVSRVADQVESAARQRAATSRRKARTTKDLRTRRAYENDANFWQMGAGVPRVAATAYLSALDIAHNDGLARRSTRKRLSRQYHSSRQLCCS
jgi:hypothetical protein